MRRPRATPGGIAPAAGLLLAVVAVVAVEARRRREAVQAARDLAAIRELALTDALSGLPNRRALDDALGGMAAQARRSSSPLSAVRLDLDHFKQINDRHGHAAGDAVLSGVALALRRSVRASDVVARTGGDEFVVLLPDTAAAGALIAAEKLRAGLHGLVHPGLGTAVTASIGVASLLPGDGDGDALLQHADDALYAAKRAGGNVVRVVTPVTGGP